MPGSTPSFARPEPEFPGRDDAKHLFSQLYLLFCNVYHKEGPREWLVSVVGTETRSSLHVKNICVFELFCSANT